MRVVEALETIRPLWVSNISNRLAQGEGVRESFQLALNQFFDLLCQAVEQGDPVCLHPVLDEWVEARTQTEIEDQETSLPPILDQILFSTLEVAREALTELQALELMAAILPLYTYSFEYTSRKETSRHIENVASELGKTKGTLERLDRSKSDFIAIAAHELKTPLTLIEGYTTMLRDSLPGNEDILNLEVFLAGIDNGTRRLHEIVDDMIDVSMIDNDLLSLHFQPVWINRLLYLAQKDFESIIKKRRLVLEILPFPGSDEMMFGDDERLFQALSNVISNAVKFTPDGGRIVIDGRILPGFIEVMISDNGIGIDPEDHEIIFEKFGRLGSVSLHSSGKTKFKGGGPGLGLPITKGIIEAHGGAIWVESEGCDEIRCPGTTFHILLPLRKEPPDDKTAKLFRPMTEIAQNSQHLSTVAQQKVDIDL